jgi:hypothetical protein
VTNFCGVVSGRNVHPFAALRLVAYRVFHLKSNPNYNSSIFVSFGDINITRQTSCFQFLFVSKNLKDSSTADVKNVYHLLEDKHPRFLE